MNREDFLDGLRSNYSEQINEAYVESEHEGQVDIAQLNTRLKKLEEAAKLDGMKSEEFRELAKSQLPAQVWTHLQTAQPAKKAA